MKHVAVFELNPYHTETFPIYENVLETILGEPCRIEYHVLPQKVDDVVQFYPEAFALCTHWVNWLVSKLSLRKWFFFKKVQDVVKANRIDVVLFNSVEPDRNLEIFSRLDAPLKLGIVHNPKKIEYNKQSNERLYVLNENVYNKYREKLLLDGYILPFYYPSILTREEKRHEGLLIAVQGIVKFKRRDYRFVLGVAKTLKERGITNIRFNIIGNIGSKDGKKLQKMIEYEGLEPYFILHAKISDKEFLAEIGRCDYVMTALTQQYEKYFVDKMTASFSHSAAFKIPMILSRQNATAWNIESDRALVYENRDELADMLMKAHEKREDMVQNYSRYIETLIMKNRELLEGTGCL